MAGIFDPLNEVSEVIEKLYNELKVLPATMCLLCVLYIGVAWIYHDHVPAADIYAWRDQILSIQYTLRRDHLDSRIHAVETEIFNLKQHVSDEVAKGRAVDNLYNQRLEDLRFQDDQLKLEMETLSRRDGKP